MEVKRSSAREIISAEEKIAVLLSELIEMETVPESFAEVALRDEAPTTDVE